MSGRARAARSRSTRSANLVGFLALLVCTGALNAAVDADETARRLYQRAVKSLAVGDCRDALPRLEVIAERYPRTEWSALALWEIFHIEEVQGNAVEAFAALDTLVTQQPGHFEKAHDAQLALVRRLLGLGRDQRRTLEPVRRSDLPTADEIIAMLAKTILNGPHSETGIQAHYLLGVALEKAGRADEARARHEEFVENYPRHGLADDAGYQVASIAYRKWKDMRSASPKDRERAALMLTWFLTRFPDSDKGAQARASIAEVRLAEERELTALARFYEAQGNEKAAAVYERQLALKFPQLAEEGSPPPNKIRE